MSVKNTSKLTADEIEELASQYSSRKVFGKAHPGAYQKALKRFPEVLDKVFGAYFVWTEPLLRVALAEFNTKGELQKQNGSLYSVTLRRFPHLLDELFTAVNKKWDEASVRSAMLSCKTRTEFITSYPGAHKAASKRFQHLFDECYPDYSYGACNDVIYVWKAIGQFFNGNPVYKIGVTSERLGNQRSLQVSKSSGFEFDLVCMEKVVVPAHLVERKLHHLGENPQYVDIDGRTEFRALSDAALYAAITIICENI
jgi:hypothetical protein